MEFIIELTDDKLNHSEKQYQEQYKELFENLTGDKKAQNKIKQVVKHSKLSKPNQIQQENPNSSKQIQHQEVLSYVEQSIYLKHYIYNLTTNISLQIIPKLNVLRLNTILLNNSKPIIVQSTHLKLMLMRYLNKLNSNIRYGSFRVHPQSSMLYLTLQSTFSRGQFRSLIRFFDTTKYNLAQEIYLSESYLEYNVRKILYLIGQLDEKLILVGLNLNEIDMNQKSNDNPNQNKEIYLQAKNNNSPSKIYSKNPDDKIQSMIPSQKISLQQQIQNNNSALKSIKCSFNPESKIESIIPLQKINPNQQIQIFSLLMKISQVDRYEYGFMYNHVLKKIKFSNAQCKKRLKMAQQFFKNEHDQNKKKNKKLINSILPFFQFNNIKLELQIMNEKTKQYQQQFIDQFDRIFIRYLTLPLAKVSNQIDNTFLYTDIFIFKIQEINRDQIIGEGGFSILYRVKINFIYRTREIKIDQKSIDEKLILTKMVAIKSSKYSDDKKQNHKINHEKAILDQIKDTSCVNIVKCYYTQQKQQKSSLFMDFYGYKSLDCYIRYNSISLVSLMTKIYLLCQIIQGLRFLRDNKIVHLDVKPQNILLGKGLLLRLCDFGQSYHPDVCKQDFRPGYTTPYVAPQVFYDNPKYTQKSDVYSLGILMFELFFHQTPINVKVDGRDKLEEYYESLEYEIKRNEKLITNPDNFGSYGINKMMMVLANICLKCLRTNQDERPYLDWIIIQLRQCLNYLDKVY